MKHWIVAQIQKIYGNCHAAFGEAIQDKNILFRPCPCSSSFASESKQCEDKYQEPFTPQKDADTKLGGVGGPSRDSLLLHRYREHQSGPVLLSQSRPKTSSRMKSPRV